MYFIHHSHIAAMPKKALRTTAREPLTLRKNRIFAPRTFDGERVVRIRRVANGKFRQLLQVVAAHAARRRGRRVVPGSYGCADLGEGAVPNSDDGAAVGQR